MTKEQAVLKYEDKNHHLKTTKGWRLCVLWKDGSTSWERLPDLKESYPLDVAEYAIENNISDEPAFNWWVHFVINRAQRIVKAANAKYHKTTHKLGIEIPKSIKHAEALDRQNGNMLWMDALRREITNVRIAFEVLRDGDNVPLNYQKIDTHVVWDVKFGSLQRKARLVAQGNKTEDPQVQTFASVVSRDSVRIALTIAALNDLDVMQADIQNAYLNAPCDERI